MTLNFPKNPHCFTKKYLISKFVGKLETLNSSIRRALKNKKLLQLKNGLYVSTSSYLNKPDKIKFAEFIASQLYAPSYLSLEYVLQKHHLLFPDQNQSKITCISTKTNRKFINFAGTFSYSRIKKSFYFGFEKIPYKTAKNETLKKHFYYVATKAKALFDYLYLKPDLRYRNLRKLKHQIFIESGILWANFSEEDFKEFDKFVWKSNCKKMMAVLRVLSEYFEGKEFDRWAKKLTGQ